MKNKNKTHNCNCNEELKNCTCDCNCEQDCTCNEGECKCNCECENCNCTPQNHCGCMDEECTCKDGNCKDGCNCNECNCQDDCECEDCNCDDDCECDCQECNCDECDCEECDCEDCDCEENCECEECNCNHCHDKECSCEHGEDVSEDTLYYLEMAQRIQADFNNYKRRTENIAKENYMRGISDSVEKLFVVLDTIQRSKANITDQNTLKGFEMIESSCLKAFESLGVKPIESVGKEFDPNFHNAVMTSNDNMQKDNVVVEEFQKGFTLNGKVIRHSVVKVNKLN